MAASYGVEDTVERLADLAVRRLADICVIDLVTEHGMTRPAARHRDPRQQPVVDELRDKYLPGRREEHPSVRAVTTARTQFFPVVDDDLLARITTGPRHAELDRKSVVSGKSVDLGG